MFTYKTCAHLPDQKYEEMQPKSELSIFMGYYEEVKSYMLYVSLTLKITYQGYVPFD